MQHFEALEVRSAGGNGRLTEIDECPVCVCKSVLTDDTEVYGPVDRQRQCKQALSTFTAIDCNWGESALQYRLGIDSVRSASPTAIGTPEPLLCGPEAGLLRSVVTSVAVEVVTSAVVIMFVVVIALMVFVALGIGVAFAICASIVREVEVPDLIFAPDLALSGFARRLGSAQGEKADGSGESGGEQDRAFHRVLLHVSSGRITARDATLMS